MGICTNCEKRNELCQRRDGPKRQSVRSCPGVPSSGSALPGDAPFVGTLAPSIVADRTETPSEECEDDNSGCPSEEMQSLNRGYLGKHSIMSIHGPLSASASASAGSLSTLLERQCFVASQADQLPAPSMIEASAARYFKYLYHRIPVLDHQDVECANPSILLLRALCFVGSFLRHPKSADSIQQTELEYVKAKILFFLNHERDPLTMLKVLCTFTLWNVRPASVVTIDCSWSWLGLAVSLAVQMGLHQESTYLERSIPGSARRIAWFLYSQDKMLSSCFGRPQILRTEEFDLRPLTVTDFALSEGRQAGKFIIYTRLAQIIAKMLDLQQRQDLTTNEEVSSALADFRAWALEMPSDLRIYNEQGGKVYRREIYEYLASYLTHIITFFHHFGKHFRPSVVSRISLVASSCMIGLYQDMDCRDHINYLTAINNWYLMTAAIPQLNNIARENRGEGFQTEPRRNKPSSLQDLDILLDILKQRTVKFPGAKSIVNRLEQLKHDVLSQCVDSNLAAVPAERHCSELALLPQGVITNVHDLFPFPKSLSPRLQLLDAIEAESATNVFFDGYPDWSLDNLFSLDDINPMALVDINLVDFA
ncbi:uncharacterized protein A1O9_05498 [Exophiala aquamarina CBS 119918]|uniref:Xylanolytic transcriptional activator regulatory domain-containing protein n=1 Tax=Exophiala aquamarina CBS 119918 TaxID=1182545 RepID=A0A072PPY3_9EURO|nr:uncharacterized protein A1O9_05498 [Exophiala aquamarina CBS 119918]KEF57580.1 hypothetical protein A1O9_05498 [Exophiala aquamarina CBS 119918]